MSAHPLAMRAPRGALALLLAAVLSTGAAACDAGDSPPPSSAPRGAGGDTTPGPGPTVPKGRSAAPTPTEPTRPAGATAWTHAKLLRRIEGRRIRVERRVVAIDRTTVTCGGEGPPSARRNGQPAWRRFRCVQPTFPAGAVAGPDVMFVVEPTGRRRFAVTGQRFTEY
jgi:hypothetical protein